MEKRNSSILGAQIGSLTEPIIPCANNSTSIWPPLGWPMFACILRQSGTASSPTNTPGQQTVLSYKVHVFENSAYTLEIQYGTMQRTGEVSMTPALAIHFSGQEDWTQQDTKFKVLSLGQELKPDRQMHLRAVLAITYIISRIDRGLTPNIAKTLALYRLSPEHQ